MIRFRCANLGQNINLVKSNHGITRGSGYWRADSVMDLHTTGPGFKPQSIWYFLLSFRLTTIIPVKRLLVCVEGRGRISRSGLTQDIKTGSCVFQWIAQQQVCPVSVYCDGVGCHVLCLRHDIPVWQHIGQSITATDTVAIRSQMFESDVKPKQTAQPPSRTPSWDP